jgi:integrase
MKKWVQWERWDGGYVHIQKDGRPLFIIQREIGTTRFKVSTRAHSWTAAMTQLEQFERNPAEYIREKRHGTKKREELLLTRKLVDAFTDWQLNRPDPVTPKYAKEMGNLLADWTIDIGGRDLRELDIAFLKEKLDARGGRAHRIIAIKAFFSWLRTEKHLLTSKEDPTLDLLVPQAVPAKRKKKKAVELERVQAVMEKLEGPYRDLLVLAAATGWHFTEIERFIRTDDAEVVDAGGQNGVLAVLQVLHKNGDTTRTPLVDAHAVAAAKRLREKRKVPRRANQTLKEACEDLELKPFTFGVMRHTVGSWAVQRGALPAVVSEFLNHKDPRTTKNFYIDVAIPTATVPLPSFGAASSKPAKKPTDEKA